VRYIFENTTGNQDPGEAKLTFKNKQCGNCKWLDRDENSDAHYHEGKLKLSAICKKNVLACPWEDDGQDCPVYEERK